jgi:hypothetical protein
VSEIHFTYLSGPDIALGATLLEKAKRLDLGVRLRYA